MTVVRRIVPAAIVFTAVGGTAVVNGGYFPSEWGWPTLAFLVLVAGAVLVADRIGFGPLDWIVLGALAALVGWTALSALWAPGAALPVNAAELALVYLTGLAAFLACGSRRDAAALPSAVVCAVVPVAAYALATRLVPDHVGTYDPTVGGYLLAVPIGYSNALGFLCPLAVAAARRVARVALRGADAGRPSAPAGCTRRAPPRAGSRSARCSPGGRRRRPGDARAEADYFAGSAPRVHRSSRDADACGARSRSRADRESRVVRQSSDGRVSE